MKRLALLLAFLPLAWLATGLFVVAGNEKALVRRFGQARLPLCGSGLHYDLPWPLARIDRVNLNEVRTLTIGSAEFDSLDGSEFLQPTVTQTLSEFLTGDKNILNLKLNVLYRVSEEQVVRFLYGSESQARHLQLLTESAAAELISRSGVDFVHTQGLAELNERLTSRVRELAEAQQLGLEIEQVVIDSVYPPIRVKAEFLDVNNARADRVKYVNDARAYAEQKLAEARAEEQRRLDDAHRYRQQKIEAAGGQADRFHKLVAQFRRDAADGVQTYAAARQMALRRAYIDTMQTILQRVAGKVLLDSGQPVDLTIWRDTNAAAPVK